MIFSSFTFIHYFAFVLAFYWLLPKKSIQNPGLLAASYIFYGWVHPWFCILIATSTVVDYFCALSIGRWREHKKKFLLTSLVVNFGILCFYKYFNFFIENVSAVFSMLGMSPDLPLLRLILPVGISFYTFQSLSYTIDVYRDQIKPRRSLIDVALYISFFPQLVAGPIERAGNLLPQFERKRVFDFNQVEQGVALIIRGYFKKLIVADNLSFFVDKIYMMESPGLYLFVAGTLLFGIQIYTDFSGYTDIARGTAKMLGFELMRNFNNPYLSVSPADFWRRWHISLSTWIRDYIYIPLGGSLNVTFRRYAINTILTMFLCGLWHGAAWNYILWGVFHGVLLVSYRAVGRGSRWRPAGLPAKVFSWLLMLFFIFVGWSIFRASSMAWWLHTMKNMSIAHDQGALTVILYLLVLLAFYSLPLLVLYILQEKKKGAAYLHSLVQACMLIIIMIFHSRTGQDFIYFQF